ncbi:MAG: hypothetical protein ABI120_22515 [Gemmatimonadaceae bacterium]
MSSAWLRWGPMRAAIGAMIVALGFAAFTLVRAVQLTEAPVGTVPVLPNPAELSSSASTVKVNISDVVSRDVFDAMRSAPTNRYLLASEILEPETPGAALPRVVVLGVAMADGGRSFATCQVGAERPIIVRVGDKLGPYTVKTIERRRVTITLPSGAVQIIDALNSGFGN